MNKLLYLLPTFLVACSNGCAPSKTYPVPEPPVEHKNDSSIIVADAGNQLTNYKNSDFSFTLSSTWLQQKTETKNTVVFFINESDEGAAWQVSKEAFSGTLDEFALLSTRAAKQIGLTINSSSKIEINNQKYFMLLMSKDNSLFWEWMTLKSGFAFTFGCKTQSIPENKSAEVCAPIAESIIFNGN